MLRRSCSSCHKKITMADLLETIESVENSHDITVTSFPLRRDLIRALEKLAPERHNPDRWNFWHEGVYRELSARLQPFRSSSTNVGTVKRGIFKGLTYENARLASFFLRHAKVRKEYSFGSFCDIDPECIRIIYACIIFPTPGHLDFRCFNERIELFQSASGRILSLKNHTPERVELVGRGPNVLQDFIDDIHGNTESQLSGRTADFSWDVFRDAFEPFLVFQINEDYARLVR